MPSQRKISIPWFIVAMLLGSLITGTVFYTMNGYLHTPQPFKKLIHFYEILDREYVDELDSEKLLDGAIEGMLQATEDPYTTYMNKEESLAFEESISNNFEGIGAEVREIDGKTTIVSPIKNSPAEKAGLLPNDVILEVNGTNLVGKKVEESVSLIRGPKGTEAKLLIERPGVEQPFEITIVRDTIPLESVFLTVNEDGTAKIQISKFSQTTASEFEDALKQAREEGAQGFIIDLRQNPGGLLDQVVLMTEKFVPEGELILKTRDRNGSTEVYRSNGGELANWPVVVLIDGGSASASEIMAGALKESAGITLVGQTTFGKGLVQSLSNYPDGSILKYTSAEWLTPDGNQIHGVGIEPDVSVELPEYAKLHYLSLDKTYGLNDQAEIIRYAQQYLNALGYAIENENGILDQTTSDAIVAFQREHDINTTGQLDQLTSLTLMDELREKIKQNDTQLAKATEILLNLMSDSDK